jgi:hypothetical protein
MPTSSTATGTTMSTANMSDTVMGESAPFQVVVTVPPDCEVSELKDAIQQKRGIALKGIDSTNPDLWMVPPSLYSLILVLAT